jgi:hypothetical protein
VLPGGLILITRKLEIVTGYRFGRDCTVINAEIPIAFPSRPEHPQRGVLAECGCGNEFVARIEQVLSGKVTSCGCRGTDFPEQVARRTLRATAAGLGYEITSLKLTRVP